MTQLKLIIGMYGIPWQPYHGATGGVSLTTRERAETYATYLTRFRPRVPQGLWPGTPHRIVDMQVEGDVERGLLIATCERIEEVKS